MRLYDDIRRDVRAADYDRVLDEFITRFREWPVSLCQYGGRRPPTSDLDLLVVPGPDLRPGQIRRLRQALDAFRASSDLHRYLIEGEIRICPADLLRQIQLVHPPVSQFRVLWGSIVTLDPVPDDWVARGVITLDQFLLDACELEFFASRRSNGVRALLSTLHKLGPFGASALLQDAQDALQDASLDAGPFRSWTEQVRLIREQVLAGDMPRDLDDVIHSAKTITNQTIASMAGSFLERVLEPYGADAMGDRVRLLLDCHTAAHAKQAPAGTALVKELRQPGSNPSFRVRETRYEAFARERMTLVSRIKRHFLPLGLESFPVAVCGHWHTVHPGRFRRALNRLLSSAMMFSSMPAK